MDIILELLFTIFGEFILQLLFELVARMLIEPFRLLRQSKIRKLAGYVLLGALAGGLSVALIPNHITPNIQIRTINLVLTPLAIGGVVTLFGNIPEDEQIDSTFRRDKFLSGYLFALAMALIRFIFAQ